MGATDVKSFRSLPVLNKHVTVLLECICDQINL